MDGDDWLPLTPHPRFLLDRRLAGPQNRSGSCKVAQSLPLAGIDIRACETRSLVTIPPGLLRARKASGPTMPTVLTVALEDP
jgi:hypothetical protein